MDGSGKQDVAKAPKSGGGRSPRFACGGICRKCYPTRSKIGRPCFEGKKEIPVIEELMDRSLAEVKVRRGAQNALKYPHSGGKVQVRGNLGAVCFMIPRKTFQSRRGQTEQWKNRPTT
jgi:hypothetical protein